jgi:hypothetical protein
MRGWRRRTEAGERRPEKGGGRPELTNPESRKDDGFIPLKTNYE